MWINTDTERKVPPVFREHPYTVFMDIGEIQICLDSLIEYNVALASMDVGVTERADLLGLIRKLRKLEEEI